MQKRKEKIGKLKIERKKKEKRGKVSKKKEGKNTVDYCCNPQ